jgi:7-cyano-7-deazaguanine synthase
MKNKGICVLLSGGLDSSVLLMEAASKSVRVLPVYVRQGLRWEEVELYWLKKFLRAAKNRRIRPLSILSIGMADVYGKHWSLGRGRVPGRRSQDKAVYLPGRNLILSVKAAVLCSARGIGTIAMGTLSANPFTDATPRFISRWSKALSLGLGTKLRIVTPYRKLTKAELIRGGKHWPLHLTFSCIAPKGRLHCGRCNKCAERQKAFRAAKVEDRTRYAER